MIWRLRLLKFPSTIQINTPFQFTYTVLDDLGIPPGPLHPRLMIQITTVDKTAIRIEPSTFPLDLCNKQYFKATARCCYHPSAGASAGGMKKLLSIGLVAEVVIDQQDDALPIPTSPSVLPIGPLDDARLSVLGTCIYDASADNPTPVTFLSCCVEVTLAAASTATGNANSQIYRQFRWGNGEAATGKILRITEQFGEQLGTRLWDCSMLMAEYLSVVVFATGKSSDKRPNALDKQQRPQRIIELGAGVGLSSLVAGLLQLETVKRGNSSTTSAKQRLIAATDIGDATMQLLRLNINQLPRGSSVQCVEFDWNDPSGFHRRLVSSSSSSGRERNASQSAEGFDLILAADVLYNPSSHRALLESLNWLCSLRSSETEILIAYKYRTAGEQAFFTQATDEFGFHVEVVYQRVDSLLPEATIYRLTKRI